MPRNRPMASRRNAPRKPGFEVVRRRLTEWAVRRLDRVAGAASGFGAALRRQSAAGFLADPGVRRVMTAGLAGLAALVVLVLAIRTGNEPGDSVGQKLTGDAAPPAVMPNQVGLAVPKPKPESPLSGAAESSPARAPAADEMQVGIDRRAPEPEPERAWHYVRVARGDTMEIIFRKLGLSPRLLHEIVNLDDRAGSLVDLRPGDEIAFGLDDSGTFEALRSEFDDENWLFVERAESGLASRLEPRDLETRIVEVDAEITSSLFNAGQNAGLSDNMILRLAGIFGWDIDFALDIRRGDRFALVYEEVYRDGQFLRQGSILGARFINQGKSFEAVRFDAGDGPDYYDPEGRPMRKQFLRAPINFTRVTSNFNPRRVHPVTRRVRPHNGTDYGAPTGTPVWAAGDGTVVEAGYGAANGNYIFLKHGNHIVTRYLHLSKKRVKRGDRVRQGQTIGLVGATGLATGPHLHYEFLIHGRHRDPRRVDLPEATPLPDDILPEFRASTSGMFAQLQELLPPNVLLASANGERASNSESPRHNATAPK